MSQIIAVPEEGVERVVVPNQYATLAIVQPLLEPHSLCANLLISSSMPLRRLDAEMPITLGALLPHVHFLVPRRITDAFCSDIGVCPDGRWRKAACGVCFTRYQCATAKTS